MGTVFGSIPYETPKFKEIASTLGNRIKVRKYDAYYVAKVYSSDFGSQSKASFLNTAFFVLADYIGVTKKGNNKVITSNQSEIMAMTAPIVSEKIKTTNPVVGEKIKMTAPVVSEQIKMTAPLVSSTNPPNISGASFEADREQWGVAFILPSKYNENNKPPLPLNDLIKIEMVPPKLVAVKTFSGWSTVKKCQKYMNQIVEEIDEGSEFEVIKDVTGEPKWEDYIYNDPFVIPMLRTNEVAVYIKESNVSGS